MATLDTLMANGTLQSISVEETGAAGPQRCILGTARFLECLQRISNAPKQVGSSDTPGEQLDAFVADYVDNALLRDPYDCHIMTPPIKCIWELKTPDVRMFGWFFEKDCFIGICADLANRVKDHDLYNGYRDEVFTARAIINLEPVSHLTESLITDVLSNSKQQAV